MARDSGAGTSGPAVPSGPGRESGEVVRRQADADFLHPTEITQPLVADHEAAHVPQVVVGVEVRERGHAVALVLREL